ncbi:MAG: hypothetical protein II320_01520 [Oscillospiraceae bacterium]|jgi:hypothetical protein|nr:hypothetical protein [Oscillospiraceae bacterium]
MEALAGVVAIYLVFCFVILGLSLVQYIFQSLGLYTIAKRRGISKPWLAWVPVGNVWIMGCISDQYQYVARGLNKNKRTLLMWLNVIMVVLLGLYTAFMVTMIIAQENGDYMMTGALGIMLLALVMFAVSVWYSILVYMAQFDLFRSAEPDNAVLYLVLSILIGGIVNAILVFICRNKDGGMPPRRVVEPVAAPVEPWQGDM